jgi:hypothetical protein
LPRTNVLRRLRELAQAGQVVGTVAGWLADLDRFDELIMQADIDHAHEIIDRAAHLMIELTAMGSAPSSKTAPTASSETTRERYMKEISANPKWRDTTKSGNGFVIGGVKASTAKDK